MSAPKLRQDWLPGGPFGPNQRGQRPQPKKPATFRTHEAGDLRLRYLAAGRCIGCGLATITTPPYLCPSCVRALRRPRTPKPVQLTIDDIEPE